MGRQFELKGDSGSHLSFHEWGLGLSDQSIYGDRRARTGVDGVNLGVQISNPMGGGFFSMIRTRTKSFFPSMGNRRSTSPIPTSIMVALGFVVAKAVRIVRRCWRCKRWRVICSEVLYEASIIFVHDSHMLCHTMYLTVEAL
ncbi:hypothetical protein Acr_24g0007410 [Actinidia rufa]|uniref:Uncharacterized protein n=1 Tax=Actinidia rufa TaxID=165716 RepID=A0A7J0GV05_9ERIC|nr:hypothetical protein Acr_24g0007410 [Actinidia rufa]